MGTFVLTGSGSGIGATLAQQLRDDGHSVIGVDLKNANITADLATAAGRQAAIDAITERASDGIDGFVPLAGLGGNIPDGALVCAVNYFGTVRLVEGLRPLLAKNNAPVVLLSSNSSAMDVQGDALIAAMLAGDESRSAELAVADNVAGIQYMLSKRAVAFWMRRNCMDLAGDGIRINAIAPGVISTPMTDPLFNSMNEVMKGLIDGTPLKRTGQPEEIARFIRFLLSEDSSFICGSMLFIDGGYDAAMRTDHV